MTWIRGPWWDSFWILSGLPMGLTLAFAIPRDGLLIFFTLVVFLETGHSFSPIVLAWSHADFRRLMMEQKWKYIATPAGIFTVALFVGAMTSLGWSSYVPGRRQMWHLTDAWNWFPVVMWGYWVWNIYHFGMQNFGVAQLYRRGRSVGNLQRLSVKYSCLAVTAFGMAGLPLLTHSPEVLMIAFGVFAFAHWTQAIGLCSAASPHPWLFPIAALSLGSIGFVWMVPTPHGNLIRVIPVIICARAGLGFVHFLYDRWLWRRASPIMVNLLRTRGA